MGSSCMALVQSFLSANPQFRGAGYGGNAGPWMTGEGEAAFYSMYTSCRPSDAVLAMDQFVIANPFFMTTYADGTRILNQEGLQAFSQSYPQFVGDPSITTRLPVDANLIDRFLGPSSFTPPGLDYQWNIGWFGTLMVAGISGYVGYQLGQRAVRSHRAK